MKQFVKTNFVLILVISLAAFLRIFGLNFQSLWDDEIATMIESDPALSLSEAYNTYRNYDNVPPLYFLLLRFIFSVTGYSAFILRLFSALLSIGAVYAVFLLGRELHSKKVGIISAILLSVNFFHIQYAQEGRPYALMSFFTLISFYYLARYIKTINIKNGVYYALASVATLYAHYYSVFTVFSQILILLYYVISMDPINRKKLLLHLPILAIGGLILYSPALPQFFLNAKMHSTWIPFPESDAFSSFFKEFFGNSEIVLFFIYTFIILFFTQLVNQNKGVTGNEDFQSKNYTLTYVILLVWIVGYLIVPLVRTYLVLPMLIPRYFSSLIPSICIMAAIGISQAGNALVRNLLLVFFILFSLNDVFIIKNFYRTPYKADYRAASTFVLNHRLANEEVVARVGWHYGHFFKAGKPSVPVTWNTPDEYVTRLLKDTSLLKSFWYAGANEDNISLNNNNSKFLSEHFYINKRAEFYRTNAYYFLAKKPEDIILDINGFTPFKPNGKGIINVSENSVISYPALKLTQGNYSFHICARNESGIKGSKADLQLVLRVNNSMAGNCEIKNGPIFESSDVSFHLPKDTTVFFEIIPQYLDKNAKNSSGIQFTSACITKK